MLWNNLKWLKNKETLLKIIFYFFLDDKWKNRKIENRKNHSFLLRMNLNLSINYFLLKFLSFLCFISSVGLCYEFFLYFISKNLFFAFGFDDYFSLLSVVASRSLSHSSYWVLSILFWAGVGQFLTFLIIFCNCKFDILTTLYFFLFFIS